MTITKDIRIEEYDYALPDGRIAKFPLNQRDQSKLLIHNNGIIQTTVFENLSDFLPERSFLVFNNTKVIQARLIFQKETGAQIEIFCLEPRLPADYAQIFMQNQECVWLCMIGNAKRWKEGKLRKIIENKKCTIECERLESYGDTHLIKFNWDNREITFAEILEICGELPIPPYLNRKTEDEDNETYQTVYSKIKGSVAAPTAGLHFTPTVFDSLKNKEIDCDELTLHVGAGTFKPVKTATIAEHTMHTEFFSVKKSIIEQFAKSNRPVIAVGTTSVRSIESLYYLGVKLTINPDLNPENFEIDQWMPYQDGNSQLAVSDAVNAILDYLERNNLDKINCHTQIMIVPGYEFKIVKGIITNFHQPKSTLLLLISAFLKGKWKELYDYALENEFRFLSYGDSSLLL